MIVYLFCSQAIPDFKTFLCNGQQAITYYKRITELRKPEYQDVTLFLMYQEILTIDDRVT